MLDEDKLAELVRKYPILYDTLHQAYKERDAVRNAWQDVEMALEFTSDGEFARQYSDVFKKRYLQKRAILKKANKSGPSSAVVLKAKKDLKLYAKQHNL